MSLGVEPENHDVEPDEHGVRAVRDLLLIDPAGPLVAACDCVGGIGPRPGDTYAAPATTCAHFAARVPLLEVICAGATPIALLNTLCQDRESAEPIIDELRRCAAQAGIPAAAVTGSTEDNVTTISTSIGVTVLGIAGGPTSPGGARPGDVVVCVGLPRSAPHDEVYVGHPDIVPLDEVCALVGSGLVHDALPVGSRGLAWEVPQLAAAAGLGVEWVPGQSVPVERSGGPSTCVLIALRADDLSAAHSLVDAERPWHTVALIR